jgi:hypothetical protein
MVCYCGYLIGFVEVWLINSGGNPSYSDCNQHENTNFTERCSVIKSLKVAQDAFNNTNYEGAIPLFEKAQELLNELD